jgi:hypothetical protein
MIIVVIMVVVMIMVAVMMPVARNVFAVVPIVPDKIDRATAGMIFSAVTGPMSLVSRGHMQIYRRTGEGRIPVNHNGMRINERRTLRYVAEIDLAKESRVADIHGHSDIGRQGGRGGDNQPNQQNTLHAFYP